jgi:hypothetical protein
MLYKATSSEKYVAEFKDRFSNFAQKAPILISFVLSAQKVSVIHENSGTAYDFEWDFTVPVKAFIHEIKQVLSDAHYPRIVRTTYENYTEDEIATMLSSGVSIDNLPKQKEIKTVYKIDRLVALKDRFILQDEKTNRLYMYQLNYSSIFFLKNYRNGKYKTIEAAGDFFFSKATLVSELTKDSF